jgi:hypothetical protein
MMADVFISHATEDKDAIARPLAKSLRSQGFEVWYDEYSLRLGDSLREAIDDGLRQARYGVVILSPSFFTKAWPRRELDGLVARETGEGVKTILPVWHNVSVAQVREFSPTLADRHAVSTDRGLAHVVQNIVRELREPPEGVRDQRPPAATHKAINIPLGYERRLNAIKFDIANRRDPQTGRPLRPDRRLTEAEMAEVQEGRAVIVPEFLAARPYTIGFIPPRLRVWNLGGGTAHDLQLLVNGISFNNHLTPSDNRRWKTSIELPPTECAEFSLNLPLRDLISLDVQVFWIDRHGTSASTTARLEVTSA